MIFVIVGIGASKKNFKRFLYFKLLELGAYLPDIEDPQKPSPPVLSVLLPRWLMILLKTIKIFKDFSTCVKVKYGAEQFSLPRYHAHAQCWILPRAECVLIYEHAALTLTSMAANDLFFLISISSLSFWNSISISCFYNTSYKRLKIHVRTCETCELSVIKTRQSQSKIPFVLYRSQLQTQSRRL